MSCFRHSAHTVSAGMGGSAVPTPDGGQDGALPCVSRSREKFIESAYRCRRVSAQTRAFFATCTAQTPWHRGTRSPTATVIRLHAHVAIGYPRRRICVRHKAQRRFSVTAHRIDEPYSGNWSSGYRVGRSCRDENIRCIRSMDRSHREPQRSTPLDFPT